MNPGGRGCSKPARTCNNSYSGGRGRRITWTQEAEVAVSRDQATALQPGKRARLDQKKKKNKLCQEQILILENHNNEIRKCSQMLQWNQKNLGNNLKMAKERQF